MRFAVDIDQTVTAWPAEFATIMEALMNQGHGVVMLTGCLEPDNFTEEEREEELEELGLYKGQHYDSIKIAHGTSFEGIAKDKAKFCKENEVNVDFDDDKQYQRAIRNMSSSTLCLNVMP